MPIATLADIVRHHSTAHPESIALSFEGHDTSYAMLDRRANQVSNGLARIGVRAGARVALLDKNTAVSSRSGLARPRRMWCSCR